jgi:hypothetical protein
MQNPVTGGTGAVIGVPTFVGAQGSSDADTLRSLEDQLTEAYKQRQVESLASLLDEDFVITFEDGNTLQLNGLYQLHGFAIRSRGSSRDVGSQHPNARFTDIWMKTNGKWRLIASHYAAPAKQ